MALTDKQKRFCEEYLIDLNATQAAIRAGYSEKTANEQGSQNLAKLSIQEYIAEIRQKMMEESGITKEKVLAEYQKLAFYDIREAFDDEGNLLKVKDLTDGIAAAVAGIDVLELYSGKGEKRALIGHIKKIKLSGKREALDSICRVLGYNAPEKITMEGIVIDWKE